MVVYDKDGNKMVCEAVDGREMIASGHYSEKPPEPKKSPGRPRMDKKDSE